MPATEAELTGVLKEASTQGAPVTVIGAGSGLTGGRVAKGGWVLSLEKFRALEILEGNARAGAAITLLELRDAAAPTGQFYAPDPTEITASVGGNHRDECQWLAQLSLREHAAACSSPCAWH